MALKDANLMGSSVLRWLADILTLFEPEEIKIPEKFRDQVLEIRKLLQSDVSGLVNSLLDFAIDCALVKYTVETTNQNLTEFLNIWLNNINEDLRGKIPTGLRALAKEYFKERWKGSSLLLLRTKWEEKEGFILPTKLFFVKGEDVVIEDGEEDGPARIGEEQYYLRLTKKKNKKLPATKTEEIFIQKPYASNWAEKYPVPFVIQRGLYKNLKLLEIIERKGEKVVGKALEYMLMLKKGTERLAIEGRPEFTYSEEELKQISEDFKNFIKNRKTQAGTPVYTTNFDTIIEHLIPDFQRILRQELYTPVERRILAGLGLVEIIRGFGASSRTESVFNPKPFIQEIENGIKDFKQLLTDIMKTIVDKNKELHRKYMNERIEINSSPIKAFITDDIREHLRSAYDRGVLSMRTYVEMVCETDFDIEVERRKVEEQKGLDVLMYPHPVINREQEVSPLEERKLEDIEDPQDDIPEDKKGPEKENYQAKELEQAPYTEKDYPSQIKNLPIGAKRIWIKTFNTVYEQTKDEDQARQAAWRNVKLKYKKVNDKWVRKTRGELEKSVKELNIDDLIELKKLEVLGKRNKLIEKLLKLNKED